jgi:5-methylcytosine-specific restriction endonuclease McrA
MRAYYRRNRERLLAQRREQHIADREKDNAYAKEYRESHKEAVAATKAAWFQRNKARVYAKRKEDRARLREHDRKARLNRRGKGNVEWSEWQGLIEEFASHCAYCGKPVEKPEPDHVVPLSRGGLNEIGNLLPACRSCNASKNKKLLSEWRPEWAEHDPTNWPDTE